MQNSSNKKRRIALVMKKSSDKTVIVKVNRRVKHEMFTKYYNINKKYMVHDEENKCGLGDKVEIVECRPLSKRKKWKISKVLEKAVIEE